MNEFWNDLWDFRERDLLQLNSDQLKQLYEISKSFTGLYENCKRDAVKKFFTYVFTDLDLTDEKRIKEILSAADALI